MLGERLQPRAQHVGRDPAELVLELVEAHGTLEQRGDREQRPAVADARERVGEGGGGRGVARAVHGGVEGIAPAERQRRLVRSQWAGPPVTSAGRRTTFL